MPAKLVTPSDTTLPNSEEGCACAPGKGRGSFGGNVIRLASGAALAQVILVAATPILSRLYSPEAFGVAALFLAVTGIVSVVGCLRYEYAIVLPEAEADARRLLFASMAIAVVVAAVSAVVVLTLGPLLLTKFNMAELQPFLWLIPVSILAQSLIQALNFWNTRKSSFSRVAASKIAQAAVTTLLALGLGAAGYGTASSMVGSNVAGFACAAVVLVVVSLGGIRNQSEEGVDVASRPLSVLRRYRKFATHSTGPAVLNAMSWQLPALLLGAFFSASVVGLYALTMKVIQTPVGLIHQAISQVFYREVVVARTDGTLDRLVEGLFASLAKAALLPCLLLLIAGRDLFAFVFGPAWDQAGLFAQILSPWIFVWFITSPLSVIYLALEHQEEEIKVQSTIFTARCSSLLLGGYIGDTVVAVALFALSGVLAYTYLLFVICRCAELHTQRIVARILPTVATALLCATPSAVVVVIGMPQIAVLTVVFCTVSAHSIFLMRYMRFDPSVTRK
jgi:lipopolysaccharide exporter